jgi:polyisoprenoid-binding protein YceI
MPGHQGFTAPAKTCPFHFCCIKQKHKSIAMKQLLFAVTATFLLLHTACKPRVEGETVTDENAMQESKTEVRYEIDATRSEVKWKGFKPVGAHEGIVPVSGGHFTVDNGVITGGEVTIDMANLRVTDLQGEQKDNLEGHLKGTVAGKENDFFNVQQYPTAKFVITDATPLSNDPDGTHQINGNLTIKDITKPVSFKANVDLGAVDAIKVTTPTFDIDRTEWDIQFKSKKFFDDLRDDFINDNIQLQITAGAIRRPA